MPGSPMFGSLDIKRSDVVGRYLVDAKFDMAGTWRTVIQWQGPSGAGPPAPPVRPRTAGGPGRPRVARFGLFGCAGLRIDQRDHRARLNAFEDGATFAERADLDLLCLETAVLLAVHDFLAPAVKDGFARDGDRVGQLVAADTELSSETWSEPCVGLVEKNGDVKFALGVIVPEFMGRRAADGFHFARETIARQCTALSDPAGD